MKILVVNGGSSSFKCWFHEIGSERLPVEAPQPQWEAHVEWRGKAAEVRIHSPAWGGYRFDRPADSLVEPLGDVVQALVEHAHGVDVVGHRIVHGGKAYRESAKLTGEVRAAIARQAEFAPAHNRFELEAVETVERVLGSGTEQIAVFDTAFHATLEPSAYVYPGPIGWVDDGIRRFGFHGISFQYAARRAAQILGAPAESLRLVLCHLGNGGSLAAVRGGKSVDTTMGFTPLDGLMMGSRSGSLDPGILIFLLRHCGYTADQLDQILNRQSGLLGISGKSGDMRDIIAARAAGDERARLAFDIYVHRLAREAGGMLAVLGGMDALVFTGGIGENAPPVREHLCRQLAFAGVELDAIKNGQAPRDEDIAPRQSRVRVLVIHAEEEWEIARECHRLLGETGKALRGSVS
ncbi:MAG TPA: acetate/propionate family kinase [Bryobacteraceae bacterium]